MDWANESYVRLYVRDTKTWMLLGWEGQCLLPLILRKLDRSGVLADVFNAEDMFVMLANGMPLDIVERGLSRLIAKEVVTFCDIGLLMPNYLVAQETPKTDKQRQKESRERRSVTSRNVTEESRAVMNESQDRSDSSQVVTGCHALSQVVTPCLALPSSALPEKEEILPQNSEPRPKPRDPFRDQLTGNQPGQRPDVIEVHELWKATFGKPGAKIGNPNGQLATIIRDAIRDYGLEDCLAVVRQAPLDGMVTGKDDEYHKPHDDLFYILSQRTFDRLLVASKAPKTVKRRELTATELKKLGRG